MRKIVVISIVILIAVAAADLSFADIYKYVDEKGVIYLTNIPETKEYRKIISEPKTSYNGHYDQIIRSASLKYDIEPSIIKAVITAESNWDPRAVSQKGAVGLMQLMPQTAKELDVQNPFNPEENIHGGVRYLRYLLDRFNGDLDLALAAYNAGPGRVDESGGIPSITETRRFVKNVTTIYKGSSSDEASRIYKVTYDDGTVLYTNTPPPKHPDRPYKLSNF